VSKQSFELEASLKPSVLSRCLFLRFQLLIPISAAGSYQKIATPSFPRRSGAMSKNIPLPLKKAVRSETSIARGAEIKEDIQKDTSEENKVLPNDRLENISEKAIASDCSSTSIFTSVQMLNQRETRKAAQLELWAYETINLTFAEKMERKNWEQNMPQSQGEASTRNTHNCSWPVSGFSKATVTKAQALVFRMINRNANVINSRLGVLWIKHSVRWCFRLYAYPQ